MNHRVCCFVVGMVVLAGGVPLRAADSIVGPLRMQWENTKNLVMGMAEAFPEAKYDYRPTPEVRTVREQIQHLVSENYTYMGMTAGDKPPDRSKFEALKTKDELLKALRDSYEYGTRTLANLTDEKAAEMITIRNQQAPRWMGALLNMIDNMDHYGNLVVYLRLNGMVPPRTAARQQQQSR